MPAGDARGREDLPDMAIEGSMGYYLIWGSIATSTRCLRVSTCAGFMIESHPMIPVTPKQWLKRLATLKVDRARGDAAPHKPLLLLVAIDMAEQGLLPQKVL